MSTAGRTTDRAPAAAEHVDLTADRQKAPPATAATTDATVGQLVGDIAADLSNLVRQEVELAKAELKQEATKAGKGAGMLGGAGFAAYMALVLLSFALVFAIGSQLGLGWAALIVGGLWLLAMGVLFLTGRAQLRRVHPKPERTIETLKEDATWARHPTS